MTMIPLGTPNIHIGTPNIFALIRCVFGSAVYVAKVYCVQNMNYGDAIALFFTAPIWAGIFARVILKEKYSIVNVVASVNGLIGIILIAKPPFIFGSGNSKTNLVPAIVAILAAVLFGYVMCLQRQIGSRVRSAVVTVYQCSIQVRIQM